MQVEALPRARKHLTHVCIYCSCCLRRDSVRVPSDYRPIFRMSQQHNLYAGSGDGGNHQPRGFAADVSWRHFHPQFMLTSYPSPPTPAVSLPGVPGPSVGVPYHYQTQAIPAQVSCY